MIKTVIAVTLAILFLYIAFIAIKLGLVVAIVYYATHFK